ncbi:hypothetical protein GGR58DRAFT_501354 [Xylaria digitata]|nr:hypothetical protein GGR58DRAFT_501354 [Xylaria digitata]
MPTTNVNKWRRHIASSDAPAPRTSALVSFLLTCVSRLHSLFTYVGLCLTNVQTPNLRYLTPCNHRRITGRDLFPDDLITGYMNAIFLRLLSLDGPGNPVYLEKLAPFAFVAIRMRLILLHRVMNRNLSLPYF